MVVAAELAVGVAGDPAQQQLALDVAGAAGLVVERPGQAPRAVGHRPADQPLEKLDHDRSLPRLLRQPATGDATSLRYIGRARTHRPDRR